MMSPVREGAGGALVYGSRLFGSETPTVSMAATTEGFVQVAPPSLDLTKATLRPRWPWRFDAFWKRAKKSYSVPVCWSTTIWLPMVWSWDGRPTITLGLLHVLPKSVVFESSAGPKYARSCWTPGPLAG